MDPNKIAILGAGTWGVALGYMLAKAGRAVSVWSALPEEIAELRATRRQKNLPDTLLPESIVFTDVLSDAATDAAFVLFAVGDYAWRRFRWERELRMTRQELQEEMREEIGDPQIKGKRRQIQRDRRDSAQR